VTLLKSKLKSIICNKVYAMRVIKENPYYLQCFFDYQDEFLNNIIRDRDIGLLGNECHLIVKTVSTFANKVCQILKL
jgi:hypothetical protein